MARRKTHKPIAQGITLMELQEHSCRFAWGNGTRDDPYLFCGKPKKTGSAYCELCHSIVFVGKPSRAYYMRMSQEEKQAA